MIKKRDTIACVIFMRYIICYTRFSTPIKSAGTHQSKTKLAIAAIFYTLLAFIAAMKDS
jgi:hypothetical protein